MLERKEKVADRRYALCSRKQSCGKRHGDTERTLCNRIERYAAAFILNMHKYNAAYERLHSELGNALLGRCAKDTM